LTLRIPSGDDVDRVLRLTEAPGMDRTDRFDCIIVGGGPAGIACALECMDVRLHVLLIEGGTMLGGQLLITPNTIKNFPAGLFQDGEDLRRRMAAMLDTSRCPILIGAPVTDLDPTDLAVEAGGARHRGRTIVLATGRRRRKLGVPGEDRFAPLVTDEIQPDPMRFHGRAVAVVGGGDSATLDALELASIATEVHLIHRSKTLRARPDVQSQIRREPRIHLHLDTEVLEIRGAAEPAAIVLRGLDSGEETVVPVGGVVIKVGYLPNTEPFRGKMAMNPAGEVIAGPGHATSVPGIYAIGDIVAGSYWRLATAVGSGVRVVPEIQRYLHSHP
jgi:thioredoxin reductase (NADPH)